MPTQKFDLFQLLKTLVEHEVEFIVVGGVGAVLQGAPISTFDLDIVHLQTQANLKCLKEALDELDANLREHKSQKIIPEIAHLAGQGHLLLNSLAGPIDVLAWIGNKRDYRLLLPHTIEINLDETTSIKVLDLETIVQTKIEANREKDKYHISIINETINERG
jgi:hypothetical protein